MVCKRCECKETAGHLGCCIQDSNLPLLRQDDCCLVLKICLYSFLLLRHVLHDAS